MKIITIIAIVTLARYILLRLGSIENQFIRFADDQVAMMKACHKIYKAKTK